MNDMNNNHIESYNEHSKKKSKPFIAGILFITAGSISLLMWIGLASINLAFIESTILIELQSISAEYTFDNLSPESIKELLIICGSIGFFFSIFTILGGIMSFKKQFWKITLLGGILGLFSIGPLFISSILSTIGLLLVFISRKEFN